MSRSAPLPTTTPAAVFFLVVGAAEDHITGGRPLVINADSINDIKRAKQNRITALDGLRGVLATVVVADHAAMALGSAALGHAANISVSVFFVLSGLVLTRQWTASFPRFLVSRFLRLWPVFALSLAVAYAFARIRPEPLEFFWLPLPRYDAYQICPPLWSLFIEAWAALAMPFIVWTAARGWMRSMACMVAMVAIDVFWKPENGCVRAFECYLVCFVAGAALAQGDFHSPILESAIPQWLGRISYSLYLTHWLVLEAANRCFGPPGVIAAIPLSFGVACLVWFAVERPSIRLARWIKRAPLGSRRLARDRLGA